MTASSKLIDSNANRGLVTADTNSLVTKGYYDTTWRPRIKGTVAAHENELRLAVPSCHGIFIG